MILASTDELLAEFKMLASLDLLSKLEKVLQHEAGNIQNEVSREIGSLFSDTSKRGSFVQDIFDLKFYSRPFVLPAVRVSV